VSSGTYPYLDSHRVQDAPVVPVAMVLEWFARAASAARPDLVFAACRELKVLKGIRLDQFSNGGEALHLVWRETANGSGAEVALELRSRDGSLCYSASVDMVEPDRSADMASGVSFSPLEPGELETAPWSAAEVYGGLLFHGPDFQVIRSLEGMAAEGCQAVLAGTQELGWNGGPWSTDAAALDGGLQLAILWGIHRTGKHSLPTSVGTFVRHRRELSAGPIRCALRGRSVGDHRTVSDLTFAADDGSLVAELRGVEMHMLPEAGSSEEPAVASADRMGHE
jgi:hypothetical protein